MPKYHDPERVERVKDTIRKNRPPLVFANEIRILKQRLAAASEGRMFVVQGGECAESVDDYSTKDMIELFKTLIIMSLIISYDFKKPVVKIARAAGQYAKPRSSPHEKVEGVELPSYFGDIVNGKAFDEESRSISEDRILKAHDMSANTMNMIRAMTMSGYLSLERMHEWVPFTLQDDLDVSVFRKYYASLQGILKAVEFMRSCGIKLSSRMKEPELYISHEALLLDYEEAMVRRDSITNKIYDCSTHFVWLGERTRSLHGPHVEFLRGIENPIGIKLSHTTDLDELVRIIHTLNPTNEKGKIVLICRYGHNNIEWFLPSLFKKIKAKAYHVLYMVDPMHGNTYKLPNGCKTRNFEHIVAETAAFFDLCIQYGVVPGGVHLEMTGNDESRECLNGLVKNTAMDVKTTFKSNCDPRLNYSQCVEYALAVADYDYKV
jgi:3-deoxy-7-phosphoheptulonate synthase